MSAPGTESAQVSTIVEEDPVLFRVDRGVGRITLNRPRQINAFDHRMVKLVEPVLAEWAEDPEVRFLIIDGAGERGFCAGGDVKAIYSDAKSGGRGAIDYWRDEYHVDAAVARFPKPVLTLMDGIVMGGGVGLAGHASHRVVTERSMVGMPETGIGLIPDVGGTYLLGRTPGQLGLHVGLTGGRMTAGDAIALGFADHFVPSDKLPDLIEKATTHGIPAALAEFVEPAPESELLAEREWIDRCYSAPTAVDIVAALQDAPEPAAAKAATAISRVSPTSVTVTLRAIRAMRAAGGTLEQALNLEFGLCSHALDTPDLAEGIRAQVVDKDRNPQWTPATLAEVGNVDAWFAPPATELPFPDAPPVPTDMLEK
ncbi:enoyl-CoA hydratase/isomerase family protein [Nakamurella sp. YIM 132087]|uniref:3-hydroxyisobutyryl-CoA hydrolase n=1 Tax=Nakamurella alba TaxID=2665158 RepID=A0A7K1FQB7_9ACTN|nr:enoyl-CoA hydratase/isomerase family protein [Nakamurella alba]MTD16345.1 enoyl-CoA hydratase/isomerase family protein [Nakamurella alba]